MWKSLSELFSENKENKENIINQIESDSLAVYMHIDEAELVKILAMEGKTEFITIEGTKMMEVYPHCAVSILRGAGPHESNFLKTNEPYIEVSNEDGLVYRAKPALRSIDQLHIKHKAFVSAARPAGRKITVTDNWRVIVFENGSKFKLKADQAAIIKYMAEKRAPVTSDELDKELIRRKIDPSGTANKKCDVSNIFKSESKQRPLIKIGEPKGIYELSELWGKDFEIILL